MKCNVRTCSCPFFASSQPFLAVQVDGLLNRLFINGTVVTMTRPGETTLGVAVKGETILAVDTSWEVRALAVAG